MLILLLDIFWKMNKYSRNIKFEVMETIEEAIENAFMSMVERKKFEEALEFIEGCINKRPTIAVAKAIIFKILMDEDCDKKIACQAGMYLFKILNIYPPSDTSRRHYYRQMLTSKDFPSLWATFCHLVESSFIYHKIFRLSNDDQDYEMKPVQHPSCDILIDFYVKLILESYDYLISERLFHERKEKSLVSELFWPYQDINFSAANVNPRHFLDWINKIYEHMARIDKVSVFRSLHQLLNLMIKYIIDAEQIGDKVDTIPDSLMVNSTCLLDIVKVIINTCKEALATHESFRQFMNYISLKSIQIKICEYRLYELIYSRQRSERNVQPITLKDIVNIYMFKTSKKRGRPKKQNTEQNEGMPRIVLRVKERGDSKIHEACRFDKPADLYELLCETPTPDINVRNHEGFTPLYVACMSKSFLCAKELIEHSSSGDSDKKLNFIAADEKGLTPLHIAIKNNACDITKMIIRKGGTSLLHYVDSYGHKPHEYSTSKEMEELLKEFPLPESDNEVLTAASVLSLHCHILSGFRENAMYFHGLQFFLAYYCDIYNLFEVLTLKSNEIQVCQHRENTCPHFAVTDKHMICSEDFEYLEILKDIINHFIKSATKASKEKDLTLDLELLPLKLFVMTLNK